MNLLFIGDVMGTPGRRVLAAHLPGLRDSLRLDLVVANCENVADGFGVTAETADELLGLGIDVLTSGNHAWDKSEALEYIQRQPRLLRPHNFPAGTPGAGWYLAQAGRQRIGILNVLGTVFMHPSLDCPFRAADIVLASKPDDVKVVLVDFHAEATSEKTALGWYLDGRVSAVVGTHTHVPTADERVLPGGTAYISDAGMTGCRNSVIGFGIGNAVKRFVHKLPAPWDAADGKGILCAVVIDVDERTGKSRSIRRIALGEP